MRSVGRSTASLTYRKMVLKLMPTPWPVGRRCVRIAGGPGPAGPADPFRAGATVTRSLCISTQDAGSGSVTRRPRPNSSASSLLTTATTPAGTPGNLATRDATARRFPSPAPVTKKT